ncbi:hypothetical protein N7451_000477 [Penicillium sp. IBT 35674x]|nr:hypothetical protein N7451_000477 [Penicillium sp. IBT 35674x]
MSFGWSAGDIVAAIALSREFYDALMSSTRDFQDLKSFLRLMVANLNLVLDWSGASDNADGRHRNHTPFTDPEKHILQEVIDKLKESVTRFQKSLSNYVSLDKKPESMSTFDWIKRQGEKVRWHFLEKSEIRERKQEVMIYLEQLNPLSASQNR